MRGVEQRQAASQQVCYTTGHAAKRPGGKGGRPGGAQDRTESAPRGREGLDQYGGGYLSDHHAFGGGIDCDPLLRVTHGFRHS